MHYNWTGILMEPDPYLFPKLVATKRNAWLINACLSPDPIPHNLDFLRKIHKSSENITEPKLAVTAQKRQIYHDRKGQLWTTVRVPCYPLFSIISTIGIKTVDFLLLDTQGLELQILLNVPWLEVNIQVRQVVMAIMSIAEFEVKLRNA